ncbi:hypothetical protein [Streptomyces rishiriensis]|uniref:Uncharacterized protein n=1 Tax=Streptomyces rishiriensis TaxID=68264 RepID=A0ABU0P2G7_STRRH|nr:hypothetical protein [Streptomyces rishiriensis]MDQ0585591.1 hypothetical protein [Streptomyces rishiriensis]
MHDHLRSVGLVDLLDTAFAPDAGDYLIECLRPAQQLPESVGPPQQKPGRSGAPGRRSGAP